MFRVTNICMVSSLVLKEIINVYKLLFYCSETDGMFFLNFRLMFLPASSSNCGVSITTHIAA